MSFDSRAQKRLLRSVVFDQLRARGWTVSGSKATFCDANGNFGLLAVRYYPNPGNSAIFGMKAGIYTPLHWEMVRTLYGISSPDADLGLFCGMPRVPDDLIENGGFWKVSPGASSRDAAQYVSNFLAGGIERVCDIGLEDLIRMIRAGEVPDRSVVSWRAVSPTPFRLIPLLAAQGRDALDEVSRNGELHPDDIEILQWAERRGEA